MLLYSFPLRSAHQVLLTNKVLASHTHRYSQCETSLSRKHARLACAYVLDLELVLCTEGNAAGHCRLKQNCCCVHIVVSKNKGTPI